MLNDRDEEKYEGQEDTEYHFSDDDVSYEMDSETPKPSTEATPAVEPRPNLLTQLSSRRRLLISGVVFLVLIFVVYKMIAPTTTSQAIDISAPPVVAQQPVSQTQPTQAAQTRPATPQAPVTQPSAPVTQPIAAPAQTVPQTQPMQQPMQQQAMAPQQPVMQQPVQQPVTQQQMLTQPEQTAMPQAGYPNQSAAMTNQQMPPQNVPQPPMQAQLAQQTISQTVTPQTSNAALNSQLPGNAAANALSAERERLVAQLQAEYIQRINDFNTQNRSLQTQVQSLNTRVAAMENEINQLVRALTQSQTQTQVRTTETVQRVVPQAPVVEVQPAPRINYNVQAIIPGRAWLRAPNGETITVAEGDMLRNIGRVTKIDPYDGIVEINTGSKTISLSYGSGG